MQDFSPSPQSRQFLKFWVQRRIEDEWIYDDPKSGGLLFWRILDYIGEHNSSH